LVTKRNRPAFIIFIKYKNNLFIFESYYFLNSFYYLEDEMQRGCNVMDEIEKFSKQQAYVLNEYDLTAITAIKSFLTKNAYRELFTVDNHVLLLESIRKKLSLINAGETNVGLLNWGVRQHLTELKELMSKLHKIRQQMFLVLN
tara:strand:+ start:37683 stop:38114 length:432 start_codon:yes stop_codon:yes gene_type:complete